ncbi:hypothetical protein [Ancylobacter mangrovi]|uniref:hypothetical protein n=1 Tax=Ancylobacter mangrovi TaxID=2972472 RepID=UPI0021616DFC|nr:hypothetical protein [Ancylobacter mangrovi]MCS0501622.1 hypothetical protein [Ancylobacter mangrovi]
MKLSRIRKGVRNVTEGGWVDRIPIDALEGVAFRVRGARNPDAIKLRADLIAALDEEQRKALPADTVEAIATEVMARAVLLDWNLTDEADAPIPFTPEAALDLLTDPEIGETMREGVAYAAAVVAAQGRDALETDAKN